MNYGDHCINLGELSGYLQYLEVTLRIFLTQADPTKNYITSYDTLGVLVVEYNGQLSEAEQSYSVDTTVIDVRNALAPGLVSSPIGGPRFPLERIPLRFEHSLHGERSSCTLLPRNRPRSVRSGAIDAEWCARRPCAGQPLLC